MDVLCIYGRVCTILCDCSRNEIIYRTRPPQSVTSENHEDTAANSSPAPQHDGEEHRAACGRHQRCGQTVWGVQIWELPRLPQRQHHVLRAHHQHEDGGGPFAGARWRRWVFPQRPHLQQRPESAGLCLRHPLTPEVRCSPVTWGLFMYMTSWQDAFPIWFDISNLTQGMIIITTMIIQ